MKENDFKGNYHNNIGPRASSSLYFFLQKIPKVELHAHLNGCIRPGTLFALAEEKCVTLSSHHFQPTKKNDNDQTLIQGDDDEDALLYNVQPRSLQDCFDMFAEIPRCVNDVDSLRRITLEALHDFAAHNVVYLELRTTPKVLNAECDKRTYLETVLGVMNEFEQSYTRSMTCRLIVAIDRSLSEEEACENVDLAIAFRKSTLSADRIVGMDLGGNPTRGDFHCFRPHLERARQAGLRITLHCGEVADCDMTSNITHADETSCSTYSEVQAMLDFHPDRLGHALFVPNTFWSSQERRIPVETCPTSNVMTLELAQHVRGHLMEGLQQHPQLREWLDTQYPLAIGTDDPGVFDTNPTKELWLLCRAFDLNVSIICRLVEQSMEYAFCDEATKRRLQEDIHEEMLLLLQSNQGKGSCED
ncbi:adenosine deaminase [Fistulifera solaris]|uniref:Adenosine deaminase n=1 Tax=Fistulifera solaris TaxID=1519565 RepID=A0A1Z5JMU6_FISSO|nr:adenosine deaminase [Fistulifera solaris]|eukprot:GAX15340.1 adenosine deaminase [Fistulifera solaris]